MDLRVLLYSEEWSREKRECPMQGTAVAIAIEAMALALVWGVA